MESPRSRRLKTVFKNVVLLMVGAGLGACVLLVRETLRLPAPSVLTAGLPSNWSAASAEFDTRIRARFTRGMPAGELLRELEQQGFMPTWYEASGYYGAVRNEGRLPCRTTARVYWQLGPGDTLAGISGLYREEGCL